MESWKVRNGHEGPGSGVRSWELDHLTLNSFNAPIVPESCVLDQTAW